MRGPFVNALNHSSIMAGPHILALARFCIIIISCGFRGYRLGLICSLRQASSNLTRLVLAPSVRAPSCDATQKYSSGWPKRDWRKHGWRKIPVLRIEDTQGSCILCPVGVKQLWIHGITAGSWN